MRNEKNNERLRQVLLLQLQRLLRQIESGNVIQTETRGKKMKVTLDLLKVIRTTTLTTSQTHRILQYLTDAIKARCPVDTGRLKAGIRFKVTTPGRGYIYILGKRNNEVALYQHDGTEAHFVAPIKAEALHWVMGGKDYFSKGHMVSGIIGTEFFQPTAAELKAIRTMAYKFYLDNLKLKMA